MNIPTLCPACLTELDDDYPYDHVAIDRALDDQPWRFRHMRRGERAEVVTIALTRGMTLTDLAVRFHATFATVRDLAPAQLRPRDKAEQRAELEQQIRDLWAQDLDDGTIALRLGRTIGTVSKIRWRLKLPATHGPGGYRLDRTAVAA